MNKKTIILSSAIMLMTSIFQVQARYEYWHQRETLFAVLPVHENDIIFLGNSITDGGEFAELLEMPNVKNRGISGDIISGVRERLDQVVLGHPAKIFLLIGVNDVSNGMSAEDIAAEYEELVKEIREKTPSTKLYLQSVMPIDNSFDRYKNLIGREGVIPPLNEKIRNIADENGAVYIDLWPALADPNTGSIKKEYTNDGLHLTGAGYLAWVKLIRPYVMED